MVWKKIWFSDSNISTLANNEMKLKPIVFITILSIVSIVLTHCGGCSSGTVLEDDGNMTTRSTIKQWGVFEKVLTSTNSYSNVQKYKNVILSATFNGPDGVSYIVPGFWDGGIIWRIRFSPPVPGQWSYTINSSDDQLDSSANDGGFTVESPSVADITANPNYRGFLKISPNRRYLTYADGTPFFWMGGTIWDGNSKNMPYETDFKTYVDNRKEKNFSVIQILVAEPRLKCQSPHLTGCNENGPVFKEINFIYKIIYKILWVLKFHVFNHQYDEINPANFQNFDLRVRYILDKGMVPYIVFAWAEDFDAISINDSKNYAKYIVARYQAYNVIWCISGEHYFSNDKSKFREIGNYVHKIDTLGHLTTIHGWTKGIEREGWNDFVSDTAWELPTEMHDEMLRDFYNLRIPFVMVESRYDGNEPDNNYKVFKYAWEALMAGALGYTYGAKGIWDWATDKDYPDPHTRLDIPSSFQMKYIVEFFSNKEWWKLMPNNGLVNRGRCLAELGRQYIVWLNGGGSVMVNLSGVSGTLSVKWFNPVTGQIADGGKTIGGTSRSFTPPFGGDAVLYIAAVSH